MAAASGSSIAFSSVENGYRDEVKGLKYGDTGGTGTYKVTLDGPVSLSQAPAPQGGGAPANNGGVALAGPGAPPNVGAAPVGGAEQLHQLDPTTARPVRPG